MSIRSQFALRGWKTPVTRREILAGHLITALTDLIEEYCAPFEWPLREAAIHWLAGQEFHSLGGPTTPSEIFGRAVRMSDFRNEFGEVRDCLRRANIELRFDPEDDSDDEEYPAR